MFVRKKANKSGTISVQIIDKSSGKYVVYQTISSSSDKAELDFLVKKAHREIASISKQLQISFDAVAEMQFVDSFVNSIESLALVGPELLLGRIFDQIGYNAITNDLFRNLVIARLVYPVSKLKTTDYLFKYKGIEISVYSIYRYLDHMLREEMDRIKQISLNHTLSLFGGKISLMFYDVTTLYFEASDEDDLRKMGFSKDGKHQQPQIVLGLLVSEGGYPLDYDIFEGNKYEGETLLPIIERFERRYKPDQLIVIADAGLLSRRNIALLTTKGFLYILGGRIKNESAKIKEQVLDLKLSDQQSVAIDKDGSTLVVSYKYSRALKDAHNRKRGLEKLEKNLKSGKLSKKNINNKGYNKYLKLDGDVTIKIDYEKYLEDAKWDGLKGYQTNTQLAKEEVIEKYNQLWNIEKTFRISKSDLQIRPIYHRLRRRIEAHICIAFAACKIYKELKRQLKVHESQLSPEKVIDILKTIYKISIITPYSNKLHERLILKTDEQKDLATLFDLRI